MALHAGHAEGGVASPGRLQPTLLFLPAGRLPGALSSQLGALAAGNSGGVLLDSKGRLIGVNTAIADPTGDSMQPSFEALSSCNARPQMCLTASGMSPLLSTLDLARRLPIVCAPALLPCCHFAETTSHSTSAGRGASSGVGFAIPIDTVNGLVDQILKFGRVVRPVRVAADWKPIPEQVTF